MKSKRYEPRWRSFDCSLFCFMGSMMINTSVAPKMFYKAWFPDMQFQAARACFSVDHFVTHRYLQMWNEKKSFSLIISSLKSESGAKLVQITLYVKHRAVKLFFRWLFNNRQLFTQLANWISSFFTTISSSSFTDVVVAFHVHQQIIHVIAFSWCPANKRWWRTCGGASSTWKVKFAAILINLFRKALSHWMWKHYYSKISFNMMQRLWQF